MKFYVDGKEITIANNIKIFDCGSEGKLYQIENDVYKIYYPNTLNEGFGNKKIYHQALLGIKGLLVYGLLLYYLIKNLIMSAV